MKNIILCLVVLLGFNSPVNAQSMISIFAGGGSSLGDGGPATAASIASTQGVCSDLAGNIYVMEEGGGRVRKITPAGIISTVAGHGSSGFSGDGGPATAATFSAYGLSCDAVGNLLIGDWNNNRIRRVDATTGIITTVAGNGSSSSSGDGGPATAAGVNRPIEAAIDHLGNIYISEYGGGKIRKVDATTGNISTVTTLISSPCQLAIDPSNNVFVASQGGGRIYKINTSGGVSIVAGGGSGTGSGVAATATSLAGPEGVTVDCSGNIVIADNDHSLVREVDASGIVTTIGGSGSSTVSYSEIPATSAGFSNQWVAIDVAGNLYVTTGGSEVYKITHISSTGSGFSGYYSVPGRSVCIGDSTSFGASGGRWTSSDISVATIDSITGTATGISAGTAAISCTSIGCGTLVTTVNVNPSCTGTPTAGYTFITGASTCGDPDTMKLTGNSVGCGIVFQWQSSANGITWNNVAGGDISSYPFYRGYTPTYNRCALTCSGSGITSYSANTFVPHTTGVGLHTISNPPDTVCMGARFYVSTCSMPSSHFYTKTWYGDGSSDTNGLVTPGMPHVTIVHHYAYPGTYSVKQIVYDGTAAVDSASFSYEYLYCSTLPLKFYVDINNNCSFDSSDFYLSIPVSVEVDSNGRAIDTLSAISGFYYHARGGPGTVYAFKFLHDTSWVTCPVSGIVYDTITSYVNYYPVKYMAVKASSLHFDVAVNTVVPVTGVNDQWGHIYVQNNIGIPTNSTVKLSYDPRWHLTTESRPMPTIIGDTATWLLTGVSPMSSSPIDIYYVLRDVSAPLPVAAIVQGNFSASPIADDEDTSNNVIIRNDTVKSGCDPNYIENAPAGCLALTASSTNLKYTIHFENTGNDTAFNIYVLDTLSSNLDSHSLKVTFAAKAMNISMFNDGGYNVVKFDFPGINLLDSSHHGLCDAAVAYTINSLPSLPLGATIDNRAGVYFDYNAVVLTNTAENVVGCTTTSLSNSNVQVGENFEVYPNPVSDELTIVADNNVYSGMMITNTFGQIIKQQPLTVSITRLNINTLSPGVYYIRLSQENGNSKVSKFVKM